ncbi:hypothetical protein ACSU1N_03720 [Thermogladius sp. 4427co]|uniref:hypothetical protein n=1 Tax=Thermogladius sp. 4427co TaxID=3450718 RepID=UPI003F792182
MSSTRECYSGLSRKYIKIAGPICEVIVIPWDTKVYDPIVLRRLSGIQRIKTTGVGRMIGPVLGLVDRKYYEADVMLS